MPGTPDRPSTAAVSWGPDRIDLFTVGPDRELLHRAYRDGEWSAVESLGGKLASAPAATAWAVDQLEVFAIHDDGQLWNRFWDGISWHEWEPMGGELTGDPTASSWSADRIDVFAPGQGRPGLAPLVGRDPLGGVGAHLTSQRPARNRGTIERLLLGSGSSGGPLDPLYRQGSMRIDARMASTSARSAAECPACARCR